MGKAHAEEGFEVDGSARSKATKRPGPVLRSATATLKTFEIVAEQQPVGVSEVARQLGLSKSTVQRCLVTLHEAGWIRPEPDGPTRWVITAKSFGIARRVGDTRRLRATARPVLQRLHDTTGATVQLIVPEGREGILLERIAGMTLQHVFLPPGTRAPLHLRAEGKAILSRLADRDLEAYLAEELAAPSPHAVVDPARVRRELLEIRTRGWALSKDELVEGISSIASPILDLEGRPLAAISLDVPTRHFEQERARNRKLVVEASIEIGALLDGRAGRSKKRR
ncbi:IclR family transcriptional regulator [Chondromyces crocatus]|uniref:IclR family transcriptional regulator n=1 Tax=Chondromyces crocatus TaxID=52 RepID=A0A0K1E5D2_CHOCO|nr:IclR family transcriptional regulator [Chondromyces crocatus]AKT36070.1 IclR family transcriptional regulator [Chondromyces crocatus]